MLYVSTNLLTLSPAACASLAASYADRPDLRPDVVMVTVEGVRSSADRGAPELRPFYRLTPAVYAYIQVQLEALELRAWGADGKDEDQIGVMPAAEAWALLVTAAERMVPIVEYVNGLTASGEPRWTAEGFDGWRTCLGKEGRAPRLPTAPAMPR